MTSGLLQGNTVAVLISWIFGFIGIPGNIYVIFISVSPYVFRKGHNVKFNKIHTFLIANLAIADLFGSLYLIIIASADRYYITYHDDVYRCYFNNGCLNVTNIWLRTPTCSFARFLANIATYLPSFITLYIAIDRYLSIIKSHSNRLTLDHIKLLTAGSWLIAISVTVVSNIRSDQIYDPHNFQIFTNVCYFSDLYDPVFQIFAITGFVVIILFYLATMILYLAIIASIRKVRNRVFEVRSQTDRSPIETRLTIVTGVLAITNFISWFPALIIFVINALRISAILSDTGYHISIIGYLLLFVNCCMNPISYLLLISKKSGCTKCTCKTIDLQTTVLSCH